jgi:hypothetical protein
MSDRAISMRRTVTLGAFILGAILSAVSLLAELLQLDFTPGFGVVQMAQLLLGISLLTLSAFIHMRTLRPPDAPSSLQADIGVRLAATGLVFAWVSGLSDSLRVGTHVPPDFVRPYVGPLQLGGIVLGIISIIIGMLLYYTSRGSRPFSLFRFLIRTNDETPK